MNQRKLSSAILMLLFGMSLLTGCSGDCEWVVHGEAWIDENGNSRWDAGEPPLPGVLFSFYGIPSVRFIESEMQATSNQDGVVDVSLVMAGCSELNQLVSVEVPEGYWVREPRILLEGRGPDVVSFGFRPIDK